MRNHISTALLALAITPTAFANNVQVSNVTLTGQNTTNDTYQVQFDLSWENSWRTSTAEANYDAAWVFLKFRSNNGPWQHGLINTTGHVAASGSTIATVTDGMGVFIHRNANGIGNVSYPGTQLTWNYGSSGVPDDAVIEVRVYALEMVYIPQGPFFIGDGTSTAIQRQFELGQTGQAYQVASEAAITLGGAGGTSLNAHNNAGDPSANDDFNYTTTQTLPAAFPKGFQAYYIMKYEATEFQYVEFLNTLTTTQAAARFPNQTGNNGHTVDDTGVAPDIYVTAAPERPCHSLRGTDQVAYADWAGLRPMTEFEYEKAARGKLAAVANEFAWGNTTIHSSAYTLSGTGLSTEAVTNPSTTNGNAQWGFSSPDSRGLRAGIFAGSFVAANRVQAGAGYYGAMELTGNLMEYAVCIGSSNGRSFNGAHGNGQINAVGDADVSGWGSSGGFFVRKGGGYDNGDPNFLRVSHRAEVNNPANFGGNTLGMRLCRTQ